MIEKHTVASFNWSCDKSVSGFFSFDRTSSVMSSSFSAYSVLVDAEILLNRRKTYRTNWWSLASLDSSSSASSLNLSKYLLLSKVKASSS